MKAARNIISLFLVITMLSVALPLFSPQDVSRDARVDLEDAILNLKELVRSAEKSGSIAATMQKAVSTMYVLAGLKTVIKAERTAASAANSFGVDLPYLVSFYSFSLSLFPNLKVIENPLIFKSLVVTPHSPPPRTILISNRSLQT